MLITGPEAVIADRALSATLDDLRAADPDLEVIRLAAETYEAGALGMHASPSLFGGAKCIVVADLDEAPDELQEDLLAFLAAPDPDVTLVVTHKSGQRGKKVLDTLKKSQARVLEAPAIKTDRDKTDFAAHEFRAAGRRATPDAVRALIEAVGKDVRELAAACQQLVADTTGTIDEELVAKYHGGKVEATGFKVADAAVAGNAGEALRLLRHAIATGVDPVPIVAVLAQQLRQLVKVGVGRARSVGRRGPRPRHGAVAGRQGAPRAVRVGARGPGRGDPGGRARRLRGQGWRPRPGLRRRAGRAHDHPGAHRSVTRPADVLGEWAPRW